MTSFTHEGVTLILGDCMEHMARMADGAYSLAVVDPPYGLERFKSGGSHVNKYGDHDRHWNNTKPAAEYFLELQRVSQHQIIWGGNNFTLPTSEYFIVWQKASAVDFSFAMVEMAWTSVKKPAKIFKYLHAANQEGRIHPTQKPTALYRWLLQNYARPGDTILDTHLGSGSSAIAAWEMGYTFTGIEIDPDYYHAAVERFRKRIAQPYLPGLVQPAKPRQDVLL